MIAFASAGDPVPVVLKGPIDGGRYDVVGLRSDSKQFPYVWIVLNASARADGIYPVPNDREFILACSDVDSLETKTMMDVAV